MFSKQGFSLFGAVFLAILPASAMGQAGGLAQANNRLDHVAGLGTSGNWACTVRPRSENTSATTMQFMLLIGPNREVNGLMRVAFNYQGRTYNGSLDVSGRAIAKNSGDASLVIDRFDDFQGDQLPDGLQWSDPNGDVIELDVVPNTLNSARGPYMLTGSQTSEFGVNSVGCLFLKR